MEFIPGLQLSELFYKEAVLPILEASFPHLAHGAGLIGEGSEVLGFDDERSMDHDWGPRCQIFLSPDDHKKLASQITEVLGKELPRDFRGFPTRFSVYEDTGAKLLDRSESGPVTHRVEIESIPEFFGGYLALDVDKAMSVYDWLTTPEELLLIVTSGKVFSDPLGGLQQIRQKYSYYPEEVWLYLLASQWRIISQEEAFIGRTAAAGDDLGSRILTAKMAGYLMKLAFLMEKKYAPYSKWFGKAFSQLEAAKLLASPLKSALDASEYSEREGYLSEAYEIVAGMHNQLGITDAIDPTVRSHYYDRPYKVIKADRFVDAIANKLKGTELAEIAGIGSVDQFVANVDLLTHPELCHRLSALYL